MVEYLILACTAGILVASFIPLLPLSKAQLRLATFFQFTACIVGAAAAIVSIVPQTKMFLVQSNFPISAWIAVDPLSAIFLVPIFVVTGAVTLYGEEYCSHGTYRLKRRQIRIFLGLLSSSMILISCARHSILFLSSWEIMALSAFFLIATEDEKDDVRSASWIYLVATHLSILCLLAFFALLKTLTGSYLLQPVAHGALGSTSLAVLYGLALLGFGLKAGIYPLHFWLPPAHAASPSHISALMSGVLIKMGIYGILRCLWLLSDYPSWLGTLLMVLGAVSAVLGVVNALAQHDLKRLLAYHSVENIGIIVLGIGLGVVGVQQSQPFWAVLGFTASFLHIWNHALFKSLLFLAGGSVLHATGIRMIDRLGGLIKSMPYTSSFFLLGAVAIVGLPPLNGFVSEFLLYLGLLQGSIHAGADGGNLTGILCAASFALLAFAGALALACFAKVFGVAFLGKERSKDVERAHECLLFMKGGMFVLALGCVAIGLFPKIILPLFESAVSTQASSLEARDLSSVISPIQTSSLIVAILIFVMFFAFKKFVRVSPKKVSTWGCGYTLPNSKLQYSASSFAEMLTGTFAIFIAQTLRFRPIEKTFPDESSFHSGSRDLVLTFFIVPLSRVVEFASAKLRILQQGKVQAYVFYIAFTLVFVLIVSIYQW